MAEEKQQTYPDIPISQWWKLRTLFKGRLAPTITLKYLQDALGGKESTAKGIYRNLLLFNFIDKDGNTKDRANLWRVDDKYAQVCKDIMTDIYPPGLLDAPPETVDRAYLINWFIGTTRVGETYAKKNALVFELLREADPTKGKDVKATGSSPAKARAKKTKPEKVVVIPPAATQTATSNGNGQTPGGIKPEKPALPDRLVTPSVHIDIQIHIAPDAPTQQVEDIFAAIEKHLYKQRTGE